MPLMVISHVFSPCIPIAQRKPQKSQIPRPQFLIFELMLLNKSYYQILWDKYKSIEALSNNLNNNSSLLTLKLLLDFNKKKESIHLNFQNNKKDFIQVRDQLFVELANDIYRNSSDFPQLNQGDKVKSIRNGIVFRIIWINKKQYSLQSSKNSIEKIVSFDELVGNYVPVTQNTRDKTLKKFSSYFIELNGSQVHDFTPTYFSSKNVFISRKGFWDELKAKGKISSVYLPNPREEGDHHETRSIPALPDCIIYVTPKYEVCYQDILLNGKKINTIVVCDTEQDKINQILQDRNRFGFNLIILTNSINPPSKINQIYRWNWFKEEIDIINSL